MINWTEPYTVNWSVVSVNPDTWADADPITGVVEVTVDRDCTDSVPLLETSTLSLYSDREFQDGWYRVLAYVLQGGTYERYPISTQQYQITDDTVDYGTTAGNVKGQSALLPAQEIKMRNGSYVPKGADGAYWVWDQLDRCLSSPVVVVGSGFRLDNYIVYDSGDTVLSACWNVLDRGKWCMQVDGDGIVRIMERPKEPVLEIGVRNLSLVKPGIKRSRGKAGVPNRFIARDGKYEEIAENNDISSPSSYQNVGRWIEEFDANPSYVDGESLWTYARRRLEELSTMTRTYDYNREFVPGVLPFSLIRAYSAENGFVGDLRVSRQKLKLGAGIEVSETGIETVKLWRA